MNIQSLSIVVPTGYCWNHCPYCVSRTHCENYGDFSKRLVDDIITPNYMNRIKFVRDQGCNTMMITGTAEPQQNLPFIHRLLYLNSHLPQPFYNVEFQTTGSGMTEGDIEDLASLGVTTLALSISSFDADRNAEIIHMPENKKNSYYDLIEWAHEENMNVRACLNLTDEFNRYFPEQYTKWARGYGIEQLTFRKMYYSNMPFCDERTWTANHHLDDTKFYQIKAFIERAGKEVAILPYGFRQYDVQGVSVVIDDDCMSKDNIANFKYAILRPNGKLYSQWDLKGSLIF